MSKPTSAIARALTKKVSKDMRKNLCVKIVVMATKKKQTRQKSSSKKQQSTKSSTEPDSTYFLKLIIFLILGSQWMFIDNLPDWQFPIPIGLLIGLVFASHEHFQIDRKIEYAVLLVATFIAFWLPLGFVIRL